MHSLRLLVAVVLALSAVATTAQASVHVRIHSSTSADADASAAHEQQQQHKRHTVTHDHTKALVGCKQIKDEWFHANITSACIVTRSNTTGTEFYSHADGNQTFRNCGCLTDPHYMDGANIGTLLTPVTNGVRCYTTSWSFTLDDIVASFDREGVRCYASSFKRDNSSTSKSNSGSETNGTAKDVLKRDGISKFWLPKANDINTP